CWPCHIAMITGIRGAICSYTSGGSSTVRLVSQTRRRYSAAAMPIAVCVARDRARRLRTPIADPSARRRRRGVRLEEPMQVDDEVAHMGVVHGGLRPGPPGRECARVVRIDADDVELVEVLEREIVQVGKFATEHKMQQLLGNRFARHRGAL